MTITCGLSGRATEMTSLKYLNTIDGDRNISTGDQGYGQTGGGARDLIPIPSIRLRGGDPPAFDGRGFHHWGSGKFGKLEVDVVVPFPGASLVETKPDFEPGCRRTLSDVMIGRAFYVLR
jgi:hypothetical protein